MADSKHTPGPWSARTGETATVRDEKDNQIAICTCLNTKTGGRRDPDEVGANAGLMAAAPDLLAALQEMLREKDDYMRINKLGDPYRETVSKMARAAIAKATGRAA